MRSGPRAEAPAGGRAWWRVTLAFFGAAQLLDVITTAYAIDRGLVEGSPISRALMPGGQLLPWIVAKLLAIVLVGGLAGFILARRVGRRVSITVNLVVAVLALVTLATAVQNVQLAHG